MTETSLPDVPLESAPAIIERLMTGDLAGDVSFLLARASAIAVSRGNEVLAPLGLRARSFSVLALACGDQQPTQREVAEFLRLDPSQIVSLVDDLEGRGLVRREPGTMDRRRKVILPTPKGRDLYRAALEVTKRAQLDLFPDLDAPQRALLTSVLRDAAFPALRVAP
jgi:DNA-binding MarR family transcriptional regulator